MNKQALALFISLFSLTGLQAQMATDSLFKLADTYFGSEEYTQAIQVYQQIKNMSDSSSMDYAYAVDRIAMVYFQNRHAAREAKGYQSLNFSSRRIPQFYGGRKGGTSA